MLANGILLLVRKYSKHAFRRGKHALTRLEGVVSCMAKRQLRMNNRENVRRSLARLTREFDADPDADVQRFRALVSGFSTLLAYDRLAEELAIDERLEALERAAEQRTTR